VFKDYIAIGDFRKAKAPKLKLEIDAEYSLQVNLLHAVIKLLELNTEHLSEDESQLLKAKFKRKYKSYWRE